MNYIFYIQICKGNTLIIYLQYFFIYASLTISIALFKSESTHIV